MAYKRITTDGVPVTDKETMVWSIKRGQAGKPIGLNRVKAGSFGHIANWIEVFSSKEAAEAYVRDEHIRWLEMVENCRSEWALFGRQAALASQE